MKNYHIFCVNCVCLCQYRCVDLHVLTKKKTAVGMNKRVQTKKNKFYIKCGKVYCTEICSYQIKWTISSKISLSSSTFFYIFSHLLLLLVPFVLFITIIFHTAYISFLTRWCRKEKKKFKNNANIIKLYATSSKRING